MHSKISKGVLPYQLKVFLDSESEELGFVELQDFMGDDTAIVNAARVSFLGETKGEEQDEKLLRYLYTHKHTSPFEQVEFKFRIKAPVVVWWQLVRHRTAHLNMQSGRYTPFEENEWYIPAADAWRLQSTDNKQGSSGYLRADSYSAFDPQDNLPDFPASGEYLTNALFSIYEDGYSMYKIALEAGVAKEQARLFLPAWGLYYTGVWKIDAHNLMHFLRLRLHPHAQFEIRAYAQTLMSFLQLVLPTTAGMLKEELRDE